MFFPMFRSALALLLLEVACVVLVHSAETCPEGPLPTQMGMAQGTAQSEQEVEQSEVSLIQVGLTKLRQEQEEHRSKMEAAPSQAKELVVNKYTQFAAQYTKFKDARGVAAPQPAQTASFISADGRLCVEGTARTAEGALAMKKASPIGRLYDNMYAATDKTCAQRGYLMAGGADHCYPEVNLYLKTEEDGRAFGAAEMAEMASYGQRFGHSVDTVHLMFDCTCHTSSALVAARGSQCDALSSQPGAWVHHDPDTGAELLCDEGPFVLATLAMGVLKSSAQLPMHIHDTVSATSCASLGFPVMFPPEDHCFPPMRIWTRTEMSSDAGVQQSVVVESSLFHGGGFEAYFSSRGIGVNVDVLTGVAGCHCMASSSVYAGLQRHLDCSLPENHPPVRDWWVSPWTSAWPPSP